MISATTLSRGYSSLWSEIVPWLNSYVTHLNKGQIERDFPPISSTDHPTHRSINNTVAYFMFEMAVQSGSLSESYEIPILRAKKLLAFLPRNNIDSYQFSEGDKFVIDQQVRNLISKYSDKQITFSPQFPGCGIILNCEGDFFYKNVIVEIKAGERELTPSDYKQVLVYAALNSQASQRIEIENFEIFNPRQGVSISANLDDLCRNISDRTKEEVYSAICSFAVGNELTST